MSKISIDISDYPFEFSSTEITMSQDMANKIKNNTEQDHMTKVLCSTAINGNTYLFTGFIFYARPSAYTNVKTGGVILFCNPYTYQLCGIRVNLSTKKYFYKSLF